MSGFRNLFSRPPLIACIHLLPLPGAPRYGGRAEDVYDAAIREATVFERHGADGLIVENFRDVPFYPDRLPAETVAAMAVATHLVIDSVSIPVGVNALRNDACSALGIAVSAGAAFIRVNVHIGASVGDQGLLQGRAHETLRLRDHLRSKALILADASVKHAATLGSRSLADEVADLGERGLADAVIVSGSGTGAETALQDLQAARDHTDLPVLVGSGTTPANLEQFSRLADGFIVGSTFKKDGRVDNELDEERIETFMKTFRRMVIG